MSDELHRGEPARAPGNGLKLGTGGPVWSGWVGVPESLPRVGGGRGDAELGLPSDAESGPPPTAPRSASLPSGFVEIPPGSVHGPVSSPDLDDPEFEDPNPEFDDPEFDDDIVPEESPRRRGRPPLTGPIRSARPKGTLVSPILDKSETLTPAQRLLILDTWQRSGLPAGDFAGLVGVSKHTLYAWKKRFTEAGPSGLMDQPRGARPGSKLPDLTKRTILMLKTANPEWGCQRISDMLTRGPALPASPGAVAKVLREAGYHMEEVATRPHPHPETRFERARPQQLWQTDLFTFVLKRQNRRVYLVAFMDDHSRFLVGYGLHASQSSSLVIEVLRASLSGYGVPEEILTDNGAQYITWRGKSAFAKECEKQGIRQIVARPRRPQTLGKIERFWGTLWKECLEAAVFLDLGDARLRIGHFIDHYNFQRVHQGIDGLTPADRFFGAATEVKKTLAARVAANALELAKRGVPKAPFYLTGQAGGRPFSVHAEGERMILTDSAGRTEIDLAAPAEKEAKMPEPVCPQGMSSAWGPSGFEEPPLPGESPLDEDFAAEGGDV